MKRKAINKTEMTFAELKQSLRDGGIENFRGEAMILAEHFCGISSALLLASPDTELEGDKLSEAVRRRLEGVPIQYIIGKWHFMDEVYEVNENVLIPRQDTEVIVEWAIENIPERAVFADLCTGSGCIAVSVLAHRKDLTCAAVEKYGAALEVARRNAAANSVSDRVRFIEGDVTGDVFENEMFDVILSNPPYVSEEEYASLERELYFEPRHALTDGADGYHIMEKIIGIYKNHLKDGGIIALEIGSSQAEKVRCISEKNGFSTQILKDLSGLDRVAVCRKRDFA